MKKFVLALTLITVCTTQAFSQWTRISSIPEIEIVDLATVQNVLFAASGSNIIYKSVNSGANWSEILVDNKQISIWTITALSSELYVGTIDNGIYVSSDFGVTWQRYENVFSPVTEFVKFNNTVYASTLGSGVYKFDLKGKTWIPFNNQLPENLAFNVESMLPTKDNLMISAGANGQYYTYNFNTNQWEYHYYYGFLMPGLQIQSLVNDADTLYACNGNRIIRSNNGGKNWEDDKIGSRNGIDRTLYVGAEKIYTATNLISGGTWLQNRKRKTTVGASWNIDEYFFETGYTYRIMEFNSKLFLAKDNGLYVNEVIVSSEIFKGNKEKITVYPNPVTNGVINIESPYKIRSVSIVNSSGQILKRFDSINDNSFQIEFNVNPGVYFIQCDFRQNFVTTKKLIVTR
ncbi:MAG: T9SS type A sorting domain-containing protein [Chryseotalea sp.]|jgi:photosystem II stability/assembly factor-like uncharacterized protein